MSWQKPTDFGCEVAHLSCWHVLANIKRDWTIPPAANPSERDNMYYIGPYCDKDRNAITVSGHDVHLGPSKSALILALRLR